MLTQWVVMVLNCNVPCHLQHCKCPDQDLWAPLYLGMCKLLISGIDVCNYPVPSPIGK